MSETLSQLFKDWMIATGKSRNTASNYFSGVNAVSKHCGRDLFAISDLVELKQLHGMYGPDGEHAAIGASNSNNVQSGLRQLLAYQSERQGGSADVIEGYANAQVLTLLQGRPAEQVRWFWMVIRMLRARWPKADHYTANTTPPDVRVGQKTGTGNGKVAFHLRGRNVRQLTCDARDLADHLEQLSERGVAVQISSEDHLAAEEVGRWLDSVVQVIRVDDLPLKGEGRMPSDYLASDVASSGTQQDAGVSPREAPALNQILYGPPGTGKTYATIEAALEVLDPDYLQAQRGNRTLLKRRFDELVEQERIRFVTFHQSFSYEDFVEGLRATTEEATGQLRYEVVDGVFKSLCEAAAAKVTQQADAPTEVGQRRIWKMSLGNTLGEDASIYQECLAGGYVLLGYGDTIDFSGCSNRQQVQTRFADAGVVPANPTTDYGITSVTAFVAKMQVGDLIVVSDGNFKFRAIGEVTGDYQFKPHSAFDDGYAQMRAVKWLRQYQPSLPHTELLNGQFSQMTLYELREPTLHREKLKGLLGAPETSRATIDARVLVIDEINRGNVSRIFGELITLIESSKRSGAEEALSVVLPYSKERFSVPGNLYLIGTMNTADRSLAGLDIALRRRFVFREMPPQPELLDDVEVAGLNIGQLLQVMNQRIEALLDRDHCLGHAYFMPLKIDDSLARLEAIFRNQILPLLQEYFFEDWQRIAWVLNDHRKAENDQIIQRRPSLAETLFGQEIGRTLEQDGWSLNDEALGRPEAYLGILDPASASSAQAVNREATRGDVVVRELVSGSIEVWRAGVLQQTSLPVLRALAEQLGVSTENGSGNPLNTRSLGRQLIDRLNKDQA